MSQSHKYRIETPNLVDDMGLSVYAFRLYARVKRVAGDRGYCREGTRDLAERCNMSPASVSRAKAELLAAGLITVKTFKGTDELRVVNIWRRNYETFAPSEGVDSQSVSHRNTPDGDRSPDEQSVSQGNEVFPTETKCSPNEQSVSHRNTPPDPPIRSEGTKQEPLEERNENPHTTRGAAVEADAGAAAPRVGVGSRLSRSRLKAYARNQAPPLGRGWLHQAVKTGEWDEDVEEWETERQQAAPADRLPEALDPKNCPDCEGRGMYYPEGPAKGVKKCPHKGLYAQLAETAQVRAQSRP
jgi:hypothetical protein